MVSEPLPDKGLGHMACQTVSAVAAPGLGWMAVRDIKMARLATIRRTAALADRQVVEPQSLVAIDKAKRH